MTLKDRLLKKAKETAAKKVLADVWLDGCNKKGERNNETFKNRYAICKQCPSGIYQKEKDECIKAQGGCGCIMFIKCALESNLNPRTFRKEKTACPKGHW